MGHRARKDCTHEQGSRQRRGRQGVGTGSRRGGRHRAGQQVAAGEAGQGTGQGQAGNRGPRKHYRSRRRAAASTSARERAAATPVSEPCENPTFPNGAQANNAPLHLHDFVTTRLGEYR